MEHPLSLELEVTSPPRSTIKTSGASVAVNCNVKVLVLPPGKPAVQLSSMTMVRTTVYIYTTNCFRMKGCYKCTKFHLVPNVSSCVNLKKEKIILFSGRQIQRKSINQGQALGHPFRSEKVNMMHKHWTVFDIWLIFNIDFELRIFFRFKIYSNQSALESLAVSLHFQIQIYLMQNKSRAVIVNVMNIFPSAYSTARSVENDAADICGASH